MPFLFPRTMATRAQHIDILHYTGSLISGEQKACEGRIAEQRAAVEEALKAYNFFSQGWGGYLGSFLPGTQAFLAREALSETVDQLSAELKNRIIPSKNLLGRLSKYRDLLALQGPLIGAILSPALTIVIDNFNHVVTHNQKQHLKEIIYSFPIVKEFYQKQSGWVYFNRKRFAKLVHDLLNPVRLLNDWLKFSKRLLIRMIEIGSDEMKKSGPIRKILKGGVGFVFSVIEIPVKALSTVTDIPYQIFKASYHASEKLIAAFKKKQNNNPNKNLIILKATDAAQIDTWITPSSDPSLSSTAQALKLTQSVAQATTRRERYFQPMEKELEKNELQKGLVTKNFVFYRTKPENIKLIKQLVRIAHNMPKDQRAAAAKAILAHPSPS